VGVSARQLNNIQKFNSMETVENMNVRPHSINAMLCAVAEIKDKKLNWLDEINKCVLFTSREEVPIPELLKEIMLRNDIALSYGNIEKMKLALVQFAAIGGENAGLSRTSEIFLKGEDKRFMPQVDSQWRSHLFIRDVVWKAYRSNCT